MSDCHQPTYAMATNDRNQIDVLLLEIIAETCTSYKRTSCRPVLKFNTEYYSTTKKVPGPCHKPTPHFFGFLVVASERRSPSSLVFILTPSTFALRILLYYPGPYLSSRVTLTPQFSIYLGIERPPPHLEPAPTSRRRPPTQRFGTIEIVASRPSSHID